MPVYKYTADHERFYPTLGVTLQPGDTFEADDNPDPAHFAEGPNTAGSSSADDEGVE